jgi:Protein of unknown function (DUF1488)
MPLIRDLTSKIERHDTKRAIGFWMNVAGLIPEKPIRVFVTYEALSELDPSNVRDIHGALQNFDRFRLKIERAASDRYDREGPDPGKYEDQQAVTVISVDLA